MSLINCPECKREISDKAKSCPHCGYELPKQERLFQGVFCPRCLNSGIKISFNMCPYCDVELIDSVYGTVDEIDNFGENHPELKQSPKFSQEAYEKRINYKPNSQEYNFANQIKCPTCQSTNVQKIGTGERVASVAVMGIFSNKINKSFECKSCGYTW